MTMKPTTINRFWQSLRLGLPLLIITVAGCLHDNANHVARFDPIPMTEAIGIVNSNLSCLQGTLKAMSGNARGHFIQSDGRRRTFDLDAALLVHPPQGLRFDLSVLGNSELVFGSNDEKYWIARPADHSISWGRHGEPLANPDEDMMLHPDLILEALGIIKLPEQAQSAVGPFQRITDDFQQLLFLDLHDDGQSRVAKEYWLSRSEPQLIARIVFRDSLGSVVMQSKLSDYRKARNADLLMPHRVDVEWPTRESALSFTARAWQLLPTIDESHPAFAFPLDRGESFDYILDLNE